MRLGPVRFAIGCLELLLALQFATALGWAQSRSAIQAAEGGACGPDAARPLATFIVGTGEVEPPPPGKARVYVIDIQRGPASPMEDGMSIAADGHWIGALDGRSQLSVVVEPGEHHFCVRVEHRNGWPWDWQAKARRVALLGVRADAGETIFLAVKAIFPQQEWGEFGLWRGFIRQVNSDEGRLLVATATRSVSKGGH